MRKSLVVGNWKMNGTLDSTKALLAGLIAGLEKDHKAEVGVCVPYVHIPCAREQLQGSDILLGSQNIADQEKGAYTAEVSGGMLNEFDCSLALVGHSERRQSYGESDELIAARYAQALANGIRPVLCVGETLEQREANETFNVVRQQLQAVISTSGVASLLNAVIAYEPVWAIGTGVTASSEQAQEVHAFIRGFIAEQDADVAAKVSILYGGSVKPDNAEELFAMADIDGGLIGGASLDADSFLAICHAV